MKKVKRLATIFLEFNMAFNKVDCEILLEKKQHKITGNIGNDKRIPDGENI